MLLALMLLAGSFQVVGAAEIAGRISTTAYGKVIEIVDADAIVVQLTDGRTAYIKLLGVDASTREGGLQYMQDNAFGKQVMLVPDLMAPMQSTGRWSYMYAYLMSESGIAAKESLNQALVRLGYAEVDQNLTFISEYAALSTEQEGAKSKKIGLWDDGKILGTYSSSEKININTATVAMMEETFTGTIPSGLLSNIISFRNNNPFSRVEDIKFVTGMTKEFYDNNNYYMSVITNINSASEKELRSLSYSSDANIKKVLDYRADDDFEDIEELYDEARVTKNYYENNKGFISVDDDTPMVSAVPERTVNINTASKSQIDAISDISSAQAANIVSGRRRGYTYKTLGELKGVAGSFSLDKLNKVSDNLHLYTDINYCTKRELESLFGGFHTSGIITDIMDDRPFDSIDALKAYVSDSEFETFERFIYVDEMDIPDRINLNTAKSTQLEDIGMTAAQRKRIKDKQGEMKKPADIPFDITEFDDEVALYTNINTASRTELESLNAFKSSAIDAIVSYTSSQPFGSEKELYDFLKQEEAEDDYDDVKTFIVLR